MNWDLILAIIFFIILYGTYFLFKKRFDRQGIFIMFKTKWGLKFMDRFAKKFPRLLNGFSYVGITIGYLGMVFILYTLFKGIWDMIFAPVLIPTVAPVLPGIAVAPGLPILGFWHWIIGILIIATIHEFSHGIYARLHKIKIKSSGFAFLGPLLAAFVEPDEKQMEKKKTKAQLSVLMAGPLSNILTGFIFLGGWILIGMLLLSGMSSSGVEIHGVDNTLLINESGLIRGDIITSVNGIYVNDSFSVASALENVSPGDVVVLENEEESWNVITSAREDNSTMLGISLASYYEFSSGQEVGKWFLELFFWLWIISFGVGLFNLLPLGPVDGGRMFYLGMFKLTKSKKKATFWYKTVSWLVLILILVNMMPWVLSLF